MIARSIKYTPDPFRLPGFAQYVRHWVAIVPRCVGNLIGCWLPREGTDKIGLAPIDVEIPPADEQDRARLRAHDLAPVTA